MPEAPLQFGPSQESAYEQLAGASPVAVNVCIDAKGSVFRRPGIQTSSYSTSSTISSSPVVGLYRAVGGLTLAVTGTFPGTANLHRITAGGYSTYPMNLYLNDRPSWADTEAMVVMAGAIHPMRIDVTSPYTLAVLGGSPPDGTQVIANSSRLLLNDPLFNGRINYSAQAAGSSTSGHEQWGAVVTSLGRSGFFTAEARPDGLVALKENTNEVFAFGETSTQVFSPDATFIYSPVATKEYGCAAAASVVKDEQSFAWLDHKRRFVYSDGRSFNEIGQAVKSQVDAFSTVSDCVGGRVVMGPVDAFVWKFPTAGATLVFQKQGGWSTWSGYDTATNNFTNFAANAFADVNNTSVVLVGTDDGRVGELSLSSETDFGTSMPATATTGFQDHGTQMRKTTTCLRLVLERGQNPSPEALVTVQYRDDLGGWGDPLEVGLGATGDSYPVVELRSLGAYQKRQWKVAFYGPEVFKLVSAVEEFEVLGY